MKTGFVCFVLYLANISGERLQDHWSSGLYFENDYRYLNTFERKGRKNIQVSCLFVKV